MHVVIIDAIRNQAAACDKETEWVDCRQAVPSRGRNDEGAVLVVKMSGMTTSPAFGLFPNALMASSISLRFPTASRVTEIANDGAACSNACKKKHHSRAGLRIEKHTYVRQTRLNLFEDFQPFTAD